MKGVIIVKHYSRVKMENDKEMLLSEYYYKEIFTRLSNFG